MASITEIISQEKNNTTNIHLYKEGLFWKAYQHSAYRIDLIPGCAYKLIKKHIKAVNCEVVSLGFPSLNISKHFREEQVKYINDLHICIEDKVIDVDDYSDWFSQIPLFIANPPKSKKEEYITKVHLFEPVSDIAFIPPASETIINRLRNFRIEQATPMECMLFLSQLQKDLS